MDFKLPDIGEGIAEGEIVKWLVKEGDSVTEDQPLVEVLTDKATVIIPSPQQGVIKKIMAQEGQVIAVEQTLCVIQSASEAQHKEPAPTTAKQPAAATTGTKPTVSTRPLSPGSSPSTVTQQGASPHVEVLATPAIRKLARDLGVDLTHVPASGPQGRITREDVEQFSKGGIPKSIPSGGKPSVERTATTTNEERIPLRGIRKKISEHLILAKKTVPHFSYVDEVDMTELVILREAEAKAAQKQGVKLSFLPFIIKAVIAGLKKYPFLNASLDDAKEEIVLKHYYNIGIAVATENGLIVPVVKDADRKSILDMAQDIQRLAQATREGKLTLDELKGGTFTITNVGSIGGLMSAPIVNYPEVAIMGVHRIVKRPVVYKNQVVIRDMMYLSLSLDHRVVDGAVAAQFSNEVIALLQDPKLLLLQ